MENKQKKSVFKYATLPGIIPRCRDMMRSGFTQIAFLLANLYNMMGILPNGHPYLNAANSGRFGVFNVIGEASNHLVLDRKNMDKIIMFFVTLLGMALLVLQFVVLAMAIVMAPAMASAATPLGFNNIFSLTPAQAETDLAFIGLDMVFGVDGFFNSCIDTGGACSTDPADQILRGTGAFPWPFHTALHSMFQIYSLGLLVIAVMILLYFIVAVIAETAQSGTPFGKRFNHVWAPLRLVVALGLLVPLASGLNAGQYITLYAAKFGSAMATNAWLQFNNDIGAASASTSGSNLLGTNSSLVAKGNPPRVGDFLQFMHVAKACEIMEEQIGHRQFANSPMPSIATEDSIEKDIRIYIVRSGDSGPPSGVGCSYSAGQKVLDMASTSHECAYHFVGGNDVVMRVGWQSPSYNQNEIGGVNKECGEFVIPMINPLQPGANEINEGYFQLVEDLFYGNGAGIISDFQTVTEQNFFQRVVRANRRAGASPPLPYEPDMALPPSDLKSRWTTALTLAVRNVINKGHKEILDKVPVALQQDVLEKGWAGAAIWYNKLAEINGLFLDASTHFPYSTSYPMVMEYIAERAAAQNANPTGDPYDKNVEGAPIEFEQDFQAQPQKYNFYYNHVYQYWATDPVTGAGSYGSDDLISGGERSGNILITLINLMFGTTGLFDMRENADVHPLAQLSALGKGIMNSTVFMLLAGLGGIGGQAIFGSTPPGQFFGLISSVGLTLATIGLTAGFILFYVLPFMPFIYFFFAVIGWIKGIFEAMVGVPLWALAHIRIDGNGLPGDAAVNGYFLILEIVIRPILILFGLLASIIIFAAAVQILNDVFDLVVSNLAGTNMPSANKNSGVLSMDYFRGPVDQFFYTVIYAVITYMLGLSCFKMIDNIPNQILRWAGQSVSSFNDQRKDPAEGLVQYAAIGGTQIFGQATGGLRSLGQGAGGLSDSMRRGSNVTGG